MPPPMYFWTAVVVTLCRLFCTEIYSATGTSTSDHDEEVAVFSSVHNIATLSQLQEIQKSVKCANAVAYKLQCKIHCMLTTR